MFSLSFLRRSSFADWRARMRRDGSWTHEHERRKERKRRLTVVEVLELKCNTTLTVWPASVRCRENTTDLLKYTTMRRKGTRHEPLTRSHSSFSSFSPSPSRSLRHSGIESECNSWPVASNFKPVRCRCPFPLEKGLVILPKIFGSRSGSSWMLRMQSSVSSI
jgi:hypothetical protein